MTRFTILLGGDLEATPRLRAQVAGTRVIAADSGIRHARPLGLVPELWLGDFDSVPPAALGSHNGVRREVYPQDKDETDGELAIAAARREGADALVMAGAFGGPRADHGHLHLAQALKLAAEGTAVMLSSGTQEGWPLLAGDDRGFDFADGTLFSVVAFSQLEGLTVSGAKWPLDAVTVPFGSSLTISNAVSGTLRVALGAGRAIVLAQLGHAAG
ncbi:thiamine diphosphokinase [Aquibium sp. A9E412]|uniref:thiamine diphosphokinase n=1 Tax=Aquibium sp. A9E412 TaxID=2976767 RepID=UPI0025B0EC8F|nr:thiamine diphosphokinase [Aquibium sp. A9E412]MDN2567231.1 thiamine diphosphokinase [Aquibium sp. A9E412]